MVMVFKPACFYNIEKHVNYTLILKVKYACCAHITHSGPIEDMHDLRNLKTKANIFLKKSKIAQW